MATLYPTRYGTRLVTIDDLFAEHHEDKMHPGFAPYLRAWLIAQDGLVGIGGSWRDTGSQPDKPGFAPEGKSFHQYQRFASGLVAFCAVDLVCRNPGGVHRAPKWSEVPAQGSADAKRWRVHCNIASESWHMQPVIDHIPGYDGLDGWQSWINRGSPDPLVPANPPPEDEVRYMLKPPADRAGGPWFLRWDGTWSYLTGRDRDLARAEGLAEYDDTAERYDLVRQSVGV